jgi:uncharacterized protein YecE (DUF72 family)
MKPKPTLRIGTAGWTIGRDVREQFPAEGSQLQRHSQRLSAVEINTSFYRPHKPATWQRWAEEVPEDFRFSVKTPQVITHDKRLAGCATEVKTFVKEVSHLGERLAVILIQLPPSLAWELRVAGRFFKLWRASTAVATVCEPRHASWFTPDADQMLVDYKIGRVAADPPPVPEAREPGGDPAVKYFRLHGSPRMYYSEYSDEFLKRLKKQLRAAAIESETWCIFDNTASGAAMRNALALLK